MTTKNKEVENMKYTPAKKLIILLEEYHKDSSNKYLEDELCKTIYELGATEYTDLYRHSSECLKALSFEDMDSLISYLENLPVQIGEDQAERAIANAEAFHDYIYENGYESYMTEGWG